MKRNLLGLILALLTLVTTTHAQSNNPAKFIFGTADQVTGINHAGTAYEAKTIAAGTNISVVHTANTITINATGGVTSVGLTLPSIFSVSGSPVTGSGTLAGTLVNENANTIFAGPTSGGAAGPTFRVLVAADIPDISATYQTVVTGTANQIIKTGSVLSTPQSIGTSSNVAFNQVAVADRISANAANGNATIVLDKLDAAPNAYAGLWVGQVTFDSNHVTILGNVNETVVNAPGSTGPLNLRVAGATQLSFDGTTATMSAIARFNGKILIPTGANARMGTATLSSGTVTVSTTAVTANSFIFLTDEGGGVLANVGSLSIGTVTAGTSFVINSSNALDSSNVSWLIIEHQ